jgi:magnesium-protoporphyrin O-methyltransferase
LIDWGIKMLFNVSYETRRHEIARYFDKTAVGAWAKLTSNAPVSRIRQSVRIGREKIRNSILSWLPEDLAGLKILDAGCGTGTLAIEAAMRGAKVTAVDISPSLIKIARSRMPEKFDNKGSVDFFWGDMLDPAFGNFDHVVLMDSIIHYDSKEGFELIRELGTRCNKSMIFTFAPLTPVLGTMISLGRLFPRSDRAPSIVPMTESHVFKKINANLPDRKVGRVNRVSKGFYKSQAVELVR